MPSLLDRFRRFPRTVVQLGQDPMGQAFSRGEDSHLPAMRSAAPFAVETQAGELCPELVVETVDAEGSVPEAGSEEGGVLFFAPAEEGKLTKVKIVGQAIVFVHANGGLVIDSRGY